VGKQPEQPAKKSIDLHDPLLWPWAAAMRSAIDTCFWWLDQGLSNSPGRDEPAVPWTTPNTVVLELLSFRLRNFSRTCAGVPALVCAPYTLHSALIADFAPSHSIVEALQKQGLDRVYVTDWRSAAPDMRFLSIDSYLADLNVAIDEIGPPVDLIGLCQGGWMSLIYAARFPEKIRRLVLVGAPVDLSVESELSRMVVNTSEAVFEGFVNGEGGVVRGDHVLRFWNSPPDPALELQCTLSPEIADEKELIDRFAKWHANTLDLPGPYFLQVVDRIFRQNAIAAGSFVALGRQLHLELVTAPVFLLAGAEDETVPAVQALATTSLLGTPAALIETEIACSSHLGLFMGGRTLAGSWRRIAKWLNSGERELRSREAASA
jgi:poly(3-hydroxyalkanoate) synthetase